MRRSFSSVPDQLVRVSQVSEHVAMVRLCRPPVNSLNLALVRSLTSTLRALEPNSPTANTLPFAPHSFRSVVLASDERVFSAGLDLGELYNVSRPQFETFWTEFETLWRTLYLSPLATVAAVESHAPAGGSILALSCDYRVAAIDQGLKMGLNETQLAMVPPRWLQRLCARTVGDRQAELLLQKGEMIDAAKANQIGFVDEGVPKDQVRDRAIQVAEELAKIPPEARAITKRQMREDVAAMAGQSSTEELWNVLQSKECFDTIQETLQKLKEKKKSK